MEAAGLAPNQSFAELKAQAYKVASPMFGKDIYSAGVQNDWQKLLDSLDGNDSAKLQVLFGKYRKDEGLDGMGAGTSGAGPGRVNQAKAGAAQLARFARLGFDALKREENPAFSAENSQNQPKAPVSHDNEATMAAPCSAAISVMHSPADSMQP